MYDVGVRPSYDRSVSSIFVLRLRSQVSDAVEDFHDADGGKGTRRSTAAADLDYKASILAAQILVERPEDRIYDDIAAVGNALLMGRKSAVLSSSQQPATGALGRPQTAQLSAKHDQP